MAWLRLDDDFTSHPKFEGWTVSQKWALLELFGYCARHKTEGHVEAAKEALAAESTPTPEPVPA